jgi:hypothetical protein
LSELRDELLDRIVGGRTDDGVALLVLRCRAQDRPLPASLAVLTVSMAGEFVIAWYEGRLTRRSSIVAAVRSWQLVTRSFRS